MWLKLADRLGLSYRTANELNLMIDKLPGRPTFKSHDIQVDNQIYQLHSRDVLDCIRAIFGDPEFAQDLVFAPKHCYTDHERTQRVYSDMYTGDWWWSVQVRNTNFFHFLYLATESAIA
jgi:hypothetical protein